MDVFHHEDILSKLDKSSTLAEKLRFIHDAVRERFPQIERIAVAVYDEKTDVVKTFINSGSKTALVHYEARLSESAGLKEVKDRGRPRVVNDLQIFAEGTHTHTVAIREKGYRSSYTLPMYFNGAFFGFVFFNSLSQDAFPTEALHYFDLFGHLVSLVVISEMSTIHTLLAAIKTARDVAHHRDIETGTHLDRMSRYAQIIARELSAKFGFTDEYIEHVFLFAPLHDLGKIGVPDGILLKPGKLTEEETMLMRSHVTKGRQIIDEMLTNFGLAALPHAEILRNIASYHHEALDGSGYPAGLKGTEIPIEARIITVADVFDALTSRRPYKRAWTIDEAFADLLRLSNKTFDKDCVEALIANRKKIEEIQTRFQEDPIG